jgi:hypothetical protein
MILQTFEYVWFIYGIKLYIDIGYFKINENPELDSFRGIMLYVLIWNCILALLYTCSFCAYLSFFGFLCMYGIFDKDKKMEYEAWIKNKD